ncbi:hypothetical protein [Rhizorhapis sp. SPR117]|uniref:hypothetical protein n=1 Tax=Rhizorhapis sp. SPR117 TaxID=2912611 RepID=UPI001F249794|nr:hypothetical protein [Rhizorhapis sp. SPR117]
MKTPTRHCSVRLDQAHYDRLIAIAAERGCKPSDVIRTAVHVFLTSANLLTASHRRIARICEFQQLALDIIIREQFPEYRDRIIAETDKRLEQYHGA